VRDDIVRSVIEASHESTELQVWDPFVRIAHWAIAAAFFIAYLTEDDFMTLHVWAGLPGDSRKAHHKTACP
jgi:hypothetical protein